MRNILLMISAVWLWGATGMVQAAENFCAERPQFTPGDSFSFVRTGYYNDVNTSRFRRVFKEVRGENLVFNFVGEKGGTTEHFFTLDMNFIRTRSGSIRYEPYDPALKFPLCVGTTSWTEDFVIHSPDKELIRRKRNARAEALTTVTVPAGTFRVVKLQSDNQWLGARSPAREVYYYSPDLGMIIAYESPEFDIKTTLESFSRVPSR